MTQLALAACGWAIRDAGSLLDRVAGEEIGVVMSSGVAGTDFIERELGKLWDSGPKHVSAYMSFAWFNASNAGQISIRHGLRGPCCTVSGGEAAGLDALDLARRRIRRGAAAVIAGGVESGLAPLDQVIRHGDATLVSRFHPGAYRPFAPDADGQLPGEGGAILVIEDPDRTDPGHVYGEIAGYGTSFGSGPGEAARLALADADVDPGDLDIVFADGAAIPEFDAVEAAAIRGLCGAKHVPVTVPKTMTGRIGSGGAVLDVAMALLSMRHSAIPATTGDCEPAAEYELDMVRGGPRPARVRHALVLARSTGGVHSAVVLRDGGYHP
jgi:act minimal PKS chain-length factor (CLF/KS beta)